MSAADSFRRYLQCRNYPVPSRDVLDALGEWISETDDFVPFAEYEREIDKAYEEGVEWGRGGKPAASKPPSKLPPASSLRSSAVGRR